ncbi:MAG: glutathione S-transferase [Caulobacter sp.]|nr:glutathione S-transferase [Caulobacter sp.]
MDLYFSPLACSLATRMWLYETGAEARFNQVDQKTKTVGGENFLAINPKGQVPTIRTHDGEILTENAAILQYVAEQFPGKSQPSPHRLREWLSFIGAELHRGVFGPLLSPEAPADAKAFAKHLAKGRFGYLNDHLAGRDFLMDDFSVADAYLTTVLNWTRVAGPELADYPNLAAYHGRMLSRPAVLKAVMEEQALYAKAA